MGKTLSMSLPLIKELMPSLVTTKTLSRSSLPVNSSATTYKLAKFPSSIQHVLQSIVTNITEREKQDGGGRRGGKTRHGFDTGNNTSRQMEIQENFQINLIVHK